MHPSLCAAPPWRGVLPRPPLMLTIKLDGAPAVHLAYEDTGRVVEDTCVTILDQGTHSTQWCFDDVPHAIEAGCAGDVIVLLKMWGSWHGLYPVDRAIQALQAVLHAV